MHWLTMLNLGESQSLSEDLSVLGWLPTILGVPQLFCHMAIYSGVFSFLFWVLPTSSFASPVASLCGLLYEVSSDRIKSCPDSVGPTLAKQNLNKGPTYNGFIPMGID